MVDQAVASNTRALDLRVHFLEFILTVPSRRREVLRCAQPHRVLFRQVDAWIMSRPRRAMITARLVPIIRLLLRPRKRIMTMSYVHQNGSAPVPCAEATFEREVLPLRDELERAARRYTRNVHDAEDLLQETLAKAWAASASFDPGSNRRAWMHRIMVNTWVSAHRRSERRPRESLRDAFTNAQLAAESRRSAVMPSAEDQALQWSPDAGIRRAIETLPQILQEVIYFADVCDYTYKEIAEMTDVPVGTVMSRLHRARSRLRAALIEVAREYGFASDKPQKSAA
jgi:RNA polymerase sigma-70 factor (ECF subfamily)